MARKMTFRGWRVPALACAVLALAAGVLWLCLRGGGQPEEAQEAAPARKAVKAKPHKARSVTTKKPKRGERPEGPRSRAAAGAGVVGDEADTLGGATNAVEEVSETNAEEVVRKEPLFKHGTEQLLAMATPSEPGASVPPLPKITDESVAEDLAKAMKDVIGPSSNDTIRTLEIKKNVAEQKEEFRELRAEGMTFVQYVNALRDKFNDDAAFLAETRKLDETLFNDAQVSDKEYKAYRAELNKQLKERGLPELEAR